MSSTVWYIPEESNVEFQMKAVRTQEQRDALVEELEEPQNATSSTGAVQIEPSCSTSGTSARTGSRLRAFFEWFCFQDRIKKTKTAQIRSIYPGMPKHFSLMTKLKAERYLKGIISKKLQPSQPVENLLVKLKRIYYYSASESKRAALNYIRWKLVSEYNSFRELPDNKLYTTAQLFGGFIRDDLVRGVPLEFFLSILFEELAKPTDSKENDFGLIALYQCASVIRNFPQFCVLVAQIPHFNEFPPHLAECVEAGIQSKQPPYKLQDDHVKESRTPCKVLMLHLWGLTARAYALRGTNKRMNITVPALQIQETIRRILSNLSFGNLTYKGGELRKVLTKDCWAWFSLYLVIQRVSKDAHCHILYSKFLDVLKIPGFNNMVIKETVRNVEMLLTENLGDRRFKKHLKNLGRWLGRLTLGKCRPFPEADINLKALIADARNRGEHVLVYVIPFVIKILESCAKSKVFKPPNPWTISIMSVLRELYDEPDQLEKIRDKIERLFSKLNIRITKVKTTGYLQVRKRRRVYTQYQFYRYPNSAQLYL